MIGKFKRYTNKKCPECGNILQVRTKNMQEVVNGEEVLVSEDYIICSNKNCYYEDKIEKKRARRKDNLEI